MKKPWVLSFPLSSVSQSCKPIVYIINQVLFTVFSTWPVRPAKTQISQSDQSSLSSWRNLGSLASHWAHSEDSDETGGCPHADQSLCWAHRSFCWFCHDVAQFLFPKFAMNSLEKKLVKGQIIIEPCHEKTFRVSNQVRLKPACSATETS